MTTRQLLDEAAELAQPQGDPVAWMWQHDETGRTGFIEAHLASDWKRINPRLKLLHPLYLHPAHTEAEVQEILARAAGVYMRCDVTEALVRRILGVPAP